MNPAHKNFKGQFEDEVVLCYFRKHWIKIIRRVLLIPILIIVIFSGFSFFNVLSQNGLLVHVLVLLGFGLLTYLIHKQFLAIFHYYLNTVMITNYRVVEVDKSLYFVNTKNSVDLHNIQDVQKNQVGLLQSLFNYGSLIIVLSGASESVHLDLVPRPEYQFKKINQVKSAYLPERNNRFAAPLPTPEAVPAVPLSYEKSLSFAE